MTIVKYHTRQEKVGAELQKIIDGFYKTNEIAEDEMINLTKEIIEINKNLIFAGNGQLTENVKRALGKKRLRILNLALGINLN